MAFGTAVIVEVRRAEGGRAAVFPVTERLVLDNTLDVGKPIEEEESRILIKLPSETTMQEDRIWIPRAEVVVATPAT